MSLRPQSIEAGDRQAAAVPVYCYIIKHTADGVNVFLAGWQWPIRIANIPAKFGGAGLQEFSPAQCRHGKTAMKADFARASTDFTVWTQDERLRRYFLTAAATKIEVYCLRLSSSLALEPGVEFEWSRDVQIVASGLLGQVSFSGDSITSALTPEVHLSNTPIARLWFQRGCNHVLFGSGCGLDRAAFAHSTTLAELAAADKFVTLDTSPSLSATYFRDGYFVHDPSGLLVPIQLSDLAGTGGKTRLKCGFWSSLFTVGDSVTVYPGCRHTTGDCHSKFNNVANFGGFPHVPARNPVIHGIA